MTGPEQPEESTRSGWGTGRPEDATAVARPAPSPSGGPRPPGVPPRPSALPPPRIEARSAAGRSDIGRSRASTVRPVARPRTARLVLKRVDPWSVFLYSVVASLFVGLAIIVAVFLLYVVLSQLGVLSSLNTLVGDVTSDPASKAVPSQVFSGGRIMTFALLLAAIDVVLLTALATLAALLYNVCAALTGGIAVTLSDQE